MKKNLELKNIHKKRNNFQLEDISFQLPEGSVTGFIGPNGAGKTTCIRLIMNLLKPDSGQVSLFDKSYADAEMEIRERTGFVMDDSPFYGHLSIKDTLSFLAPCYRNWNPEKMESYLSQFNLDRNKKIDELSKGNKTKFSLSMALSHDAELIVMDEPTSGLDPVFRSELIDILHAEMEQENRTIFFSTHITSDLEKIADYIIFINQGKIVFNKDIENVRDSFLIAKGKDSLLDNIDQRQFIGIKRSSSGFSGLLENKETNQSIINETSVLCEPADLESIMLYYTRYNGGDNNA